MPSAEERFRAKIKRRGSHQVWTGSRDRRGVGMVRIDGTLRTVQRAAWEFAHGPLGAGIRVNTCASERACVSVEHLSLSPTPPPASTPRRRRGTGSLREVSPGVWEITVTDGRRPSGAPLRRTMRVHGDHDDATAVLAAFVDAAARDSLGDLRLGELINRYLDWLADGEPAVVAAEHAVAESTIIPALGGELAAVLTPVQIENSLRAQFRNGTATADLRAAISLLRHSYRWALQRGWCTNDPTIGLTVRAIT